MALKEWTYFAEAGDTTLHSVVRLCTLFTQIHGKGADSYVYEKNQMQNVMDLINSGVDVNVKNSAGFTAENLASQGGHAMIESLLFIAAVVSRRY